MKLRKGFLYLGIFAVIGIIGEGFFVSSWARETRKSGPGNVGFSAGVQVKAQVQKPMVREEIMRILSQQPAAYPQKSVSAIGVAAADADLSSKKVWLTAIDGPKNDVATAGFLSVTIKNSSSQPWSGVTIAADIDVSYAEGIEGRTNAIVLTVYENGVQVTQASNALQLFRTGPYHLTSRAFAMSPGKEYFAKVEITIQAENGKAKAVAGVISDIKWTI